MSSGHQHLKYLYAPFFFLLIFSKKNLQETSQVPVAMSSTIYEYYHSVLKQWLLFFILCHYECFVEITV